jgi:hypothetical protein
MRRGRANAQKSWKWEHLFEQIQNNHRRALEIGGRTLKKKMARSGKLIPKKQRFLGFD